MMTLTNTRKSLTLTRTCKVAGSTLAETQSSDETSAWWSRAPTEFQEAHIRRHRYIRLASDKQSRSGYIFSKVPLTATNWQACFMELL